MIERLTETFIGGVELLEAEGRLAKHHAIGFAAGVTILVLLLTLSFLAVGAAVTGAVIWLSGYIGVGPALVSLGLFTAASSIAGTYAVYEKIRNTGHNP